MNQECIECGWKQRQIEDINTSVLAAIAESIGETKNAMEILSVRVDFLEKIVNELVERG